MHIFRSGICYIGALVLLYAAPASHSGGIKSCRTAFSFKSDDLAEAITIELCHDSAQVPFGYQTELNMPVCDDNLCANVCLDVYWDLAGNYSGFDTIAGKALTKFDHKPFTGADYQKLDHILSDRNSMIRILSEDELIDKNIKLQAKTMDAVTGATPATIKNAVIEGAAYSSYALWHLVNGPIRNRMQQHTLTIFSMQAAAQMLRSENFETQLFALKQLSASDYESEANLIFRVLKKSSPLVRAYVINKIPLPFDNHEKNLELVRLYPGLDKYSQNVLINRIISSKAAAEVFVPLIDTTSGFSDPKQRQVLHEAAAKYQFQK